MINKKPKIVVIGGGIAGIMAALRAANLGASVSLITRSTCMRSRSGTLTGGFNAALNFQGDGDNPSIHLEDTLKAGCGLANTALVERMCNDSPGLIRYLDRIGVLFDRTKDGIISQYPTTGSSRNRMARSGTNTAHQILFLLHARLCEEVANNKIELWEGFEFLSPVVDEKKVLIGIITANTHNMEIRAMEADAALIATGGYAGLYGRWSTAPSLDGRAMMACYKCGANISNAEFVEFYPYTISLPDKSAALDESIFFGGAKVRLVKDDKAMALFEEQGGIPSRQKAISQIWDATQNEEGLTAKIDVTEAIGSIDFHTQSLIDFYNRSREYSDKNLIEFLPAAHFTHGGLLINERHMTTIEGLFAAGEVACGYTGAGLLPGNELPTIIYGAQVAGQMAVEYSQNLDKSAGSHTSLLDAAKTREEDMLSHIMAKDGDENVSNLKNILARSLTEHVFVKRNEKGMSKALTDIDGLIGRAERLFLNDKSKLANMEYFEIRHFDNILELAKIITKAALDRKSSIGVHMRSDYNLSGLPDKPNEEDRDGNSPF